MSAREAAHFEFTVSGARAAADAGRVAEWVDSFLRTDARGGNLPMADGLAKQRRWWIGPVRVRLESLTRICGPEPSMQYRTPQAAFDEHVTAIGAAITDVQLLPPLILEYRASSLRLCDGNHRHEALHRRGESHVWALIWCNSESDCVTARREFPPSNAE